MSFNLVRRARPRSRPWPAAWWSRRARPPGSGVRGLDRPAHPGSRGVVSTCPTTPHRVRRLRWLDHPGAGCVVSTVPTTPLRVRGLDGLDHPGAGCVVSTGPTTPGAGAWSRQARPPRERVRGLDGLDHPMTGPTTPLRVRGLDGPDHPGAWE